MEMLLLLLLLLQLLLMELLSKDSCFSEGYHLRLTLALSLGWLRQRGRRGQSACP